MIYIYFTGQHFNIDLAYTSSIVLEVDRGQRKFTVRKHRFMVNHLSQEHQLDDLGKYLDNQLEAWAGI